MEIANVPRPAVDRAAPLEAMSSDEAHAYACAKFLELDSMVRGLSARYGLPVSAVWRDVSTGYVEIA